MENNELEKQTGPISEDQIHDRSVKPVNMTKEVKKAFLEYSMSVITERAIPSVIDSFKPVQRKIIDMSNDIWKNGNEKSMKVFQLCGQTCAKKLYVHGDASCNGAIINMCQDFKNNLPVLVLCCNVECSSEYRILVNVLA